MSKFLLVHYHLQSQPIGSPDINMYSIRRTDTLTVRFKVALDKDTTVWMDITNLDSLVPLFQGAAHLKITPLPNGYYSKVYSSDIFCVPKPSTHAPKPKSVPVQPKSEPVQSQTISPQPIPQEINIMDGNIEQTVVPSNPTTSGKYVTQGMTQDDLYAMTHDELVAHKKRVMEQEKNKKAEEYQANWNKEQLDKDLKFQASQICNPMIEKWAKSNSQPNPIRVLLATIQNLVPDQSVWTPVSLTQLLDDASVKKYYRKALITMHPDKFKEKEGDPESFQKKYICEKVVQELTVAFRKK